MAPRSRVLLSHPTEADAEKFLARMRASRELHRPWLGGRWRDHERWAIRRDSWLG